MFSYSCSKKNYLNFDWSFEVEGHCKWPQRGQNKKQISFCVPHPKNLCIDMLAVKNSFLDFDLFWEVRSHCVWSPRVQIEKLVISYFPTPCFDMHDAKKRSLFSKCVRWNLFAFWPLRSEANLDDLQEVKNKNLCYFWDPHPKNICFDVHDAKSSILNFDL